jgi:hypothetical protein
VTLCFQKWASQRIKARKEARLDPKTFDFYVTLWICYKKLDNIFKLVLIWFNAACRRATQLIRGI